MMLSINTTIVTGNVFNEGLNTIPSIPQRIAARIIKTGANLFIKSKKPL